MFCEIKPKDEAEWLELRRRVLTASDIGVILGLNPWKSVKDMQDAKNDWKTIDNYDMWLGRQLESVVIEAVNRRLDTDFRLFTDKNFFVCLDWRFGATPDAGRYDQLLEAKTTKQKNYLRWFDNPPLYYVMQLYAQMICTNRPMGFLAIMNKNLDKPDVEMQIYTINRDMQLDVDVLDSIRRYWATVNAGKQYRVDRKLTKAITLRLKTMIRRLT